MSAAKISAIGDARREKLLAALLTGPTIADAAEAAGIPYSTARRWLAEPSFRAELRAVTAEQRQAMTAALGVGAAEAVAALREGLTAESEAVRVKAASALLQAHRNLMADDLADRLDELESRLDRMGT